MHKTYYVHVIANFNNKVLYIGITNNLVRRIYEHKDKLIAGFSATYNLNKLVYFETSNDVMVVIEREKQLKKWRREKKNLLIESMNPLWLGLSVDWTA